MAKAIALYTGGIHALTEVAIREDGVEFQRYQDKTIYGYRWGPWRATGRVYGDNERNNPDRERSAGFSTLSLRRASDPYYGNAKGEYRVRLPN